MTNLEQVKTLINERLNEQFTLDSYFKNKTYYSTKKYYTKVERKFNKFTNDYYDVTNHYGYALHVEEVYRNNGTKENASMRIEITLWNEKLGRRIDEVKIYNRFSIKKINNLINEIIEKYNELPNFE